MLNRNYGKLRDDARIIYAPSEVKVGNTYYPAPTVEQYSACGYYPIDSTNPEKDGSYFVSTEYGDLVDGRIVRRYDERPIVAPPPQVIRYSGWKMYKSLKAEGFGDAFDALMKADIGVMIAFARSISSRMTRTSLRWWRNSAPRSALTTRRRSGFSPRQLTRRCTHDAECENGGVGEVWRRSADSA